MKDNVIVMEGEVIENLPNTLFRVRVSQSEQMLLCYLSGKMRKHYIKILPGDHVVCELTPFDLTKGRIVYRGKEMKPATPVVETAEVEETPVVPTEV